MSELVMRRALIDRDTSLKELPREFLDNLAWRIRFEGWGDCWMWTGSVNGNGRPMIFVDRKMQSAQRYLMHLFYEFGPDWYVMPKLDVCKHQNCMFPRHLVITNEGTAGYYRG